MVIDTMVFAYSLLRTEGQYEDASQALAKADKIWVPDSLFAEFGNVVWQWARHETIPLERALRVLPNLPPLITRTFPTAALLREAVELSIAHEHPTYDTMFVALARRLATKVVTCDQRLLAKFPADSVSVEAYLSSE